MIQHNLRVLLNKVKVGGAGNIALISDNLRNHSVKQRESKIKGIDHQLQVKRLRLDTRKNIFAKMRGSFGPGHRRGYSLSFQGHFRSQLGKAYVTWSLGTLEIRTI